MLEFGRKGLRQIAEVIYAIWLKLRISWHNLSQKLLVEL